MPFQSTASTGKKILFGEILVLAHQSLARRFSALEVVQAEGLAWQQECNLASPSMEWRFTTADAWIKLKRLYPVLT